MMDAVDKNYTRSLRPDSNQGERHFYKGHLGVKQGRYRALNLLLERLDNGSHSSTTPDYSLARSGAGWEPLGQALLNARLGHPAYPDHYNQAEYDGKDTEIMGTQHHREKILPLWVTATFMAAPPLILPRMADPAPAMTAHRPPHGVTLILL